MLVLSGTLVLLKTNSIMNAKTITKSYEAFAFGDPVSGGFSEY